MDNIYIGVSVVLPLLFYMVVGYGIKKLGWIREQTVSELNGLVFRVFMSVLLFMNVYKVEKSRLYSTENLKVLGIALVCIFLVLTISRLITRRCVADRGRRAIIIQGLFRSNLALFGLPVSMAVYGNKHQGTISILVAVVVPIYNIVAAYLLNRAASGRQSLGIVVKKALTNPLVLGSCLGILFNLLDIPLPALLQSPLNGLAGVATPLAFVVLGASLKLADFRNNLRPIVWVTLFRLLIIPLAVISFAVQVGIQGPALIALLAMTAAPIAVASNIMAHDMDVAADLAGELVAATTLISIFTMFGWITGLSALQLI